jgi:hypothetical protein
MGALYFFVIEHGDAVHEDVDGTTLVDDDHARAYALRVIRELKAGGNYDGPIYVMVIRAEDGRLVDRIPFQSVQ